MANLCFMALEDKNKVTSSSYSSCNDYDNDYDKSSIVRKLMLKCKSLLYKKKLFQA